MYHKFKSCFHSIFSLAFAFILCSPGCRCQDGETLIVGASDASIEYFPYHVGIYINAGAPGAFKQICGGTLISTTLVVTAAHCFWDETAGAQNDSSLYRVAAGKTHRSWRFAREPKSVQRRNVAKLTLPRRYIGSAQLQANDIALVTLDRPVKLTSSVGLAQVDWNDEWTSEQLVTGRNGTVVGWGISETGISSDTLKFVNLPYVDADTCFDSLSRDLRKFVTDGKFCAGFLNRNISVCPGDSGGGLVFHHPGTGKNFLRGVVSLAFRPFGNKDACFAHHYAAFTVVSPDVVQTLKTSAEPPVTEEDCGRRGRRATPLIAGGQDADEAEFPWHVNVYDIRRDHGALCGGSLISAKVIVSAAYCFYDEYSSKVKDPSQYRVSTGATRNLPFKEISNLPTAQTFTVAAISIHPNYTGHKGYFANCISVVRLDRPAVFTPTVAPVCVDWDGAFEGDLRDGAVGVVSGLGVDADGEQVDSLKWIELPYVDLQTCASFARSQSLELERLVFAPNFCAGEVNKTRGTCVSDGGCGFNVIHSTNSRYYLRGIVAVGLRPRDFMGPKCYADGYSVIHTIAPFLGWIRRVISAT